MTSWYDVVGGGSWQFAMIPTWAQKVLKSKRDILIYLVINYPYHLKLYSNNNAKFSLHPYNITKVSQGCNAKNRNGLKYFLSSGLHLMKTLPSLYKRTHVERKKMVAQTSWSSLVYSVILIFKNITKSLPGHAQIVQAYILEICQK